MLLFPADTKGLTRSDEQEESQLYEVNEDDTEPLRQVLEKAGITANVKKAVALLDLCRLLKTQTYKAQITIDLSYCPWNVVHAILDTGAGPNLLRMDAMDASCRTSINEMQHKNYGQPLALP